jgi:hypothetical protein
MNFINDNDFTHTLVDPTKEYQETVNNVINKCDTIIPKNKKWKLCDLHPESPCLKGFIKLHKTNAPIRPVVNSCNDPTYQVAKFTTKFLCNIFKLHYMFNVLNLV